MLSAAGIGLYALAAFAPLAIHPYLWTSRAMGSDVPWYFMGQDLVGGIAALLALLLGALLAAVACRRHGPAVWGASMPAFLFLASPIGRGVAVLLHSRRIWAGPPEAESDWGSFAEYLAATGRAQFIALGVAAAVVVVLLLLGRRFSPCRAAPGTPAASP